MSEMSNYLMPISNNLRIMSVPHSVGISEIKSVVILQEAIMYYLRSNEGKHLSKYPIGNVEE